MGMIQLSKKLLKPSMSTLFDQQHCGMTGMAFRQLRGLLRGSLSSRETCK